MKKFFKTLWSIIWPMGLYLLISALVEMVHVIILVFQQYLETGSFSMDNNLSVVTMQSLASTGIANLICAVIFLLVIRSDRKKNPDSAMKVPSGKFAGALLAAAGACVAGNIILESIGITNEDLSFQVVNEVISNSPLWIQIAVAVVLGPLVEELLFRGIIYRRVQTVYGFWPAAIVSALFFGVLHGNLTQGIYAFFLGLVFAYAYYKTGHLSVSIVMHVLANALSLIVGSWIEEYQGDTNIILVMLSAGILLLVIGIIMLSSAGKTAKHRRSED